MSSGEIVTVIAAVGLVLTNIVTAWRTGAKVETLKLETERGSARAAAQVQVLKESNERSAGKADDKLDKIHELTNSNLTSVKADLAIANDRIAKLEAMLQEVISGPGDIDTKVAIAREIIVSPATPNAIPATAAEKKPVK